jgi:FAD/FMN-containing dehydrogenase
VTADRPETAKHEAYAALRSALAHLDLRDDRRTVKAKSRDFFWYSPVLKRRLNHLSADFVVAPRDERELAEVLAACHAADCPVSVRGAGTGNYGQVVPLEGGCLLDMRHFTAVSVPAPGRVVAGAGAVLRTIDRALAPHGQELRMFPSTRARATVGGFVSGGSGGVGSVRWGMLRDPGNILRLRVMTMEPRPRVLELTGGAMDQVIHAYGTNGVITEVELATAPATAWIDVAVSVADFADAARLAEEAVAQDGLWIKLASVIAAPIPEAFFPRLAARIGAGRNMLGLMVAPQSMPAVEALLDRQGVAAIAYRSDRDGDDPGPLFEYAWNHTTLRALLVDPAITYLQVGFGWPGNHERIAAVRARFPDEILMHLEGFRRRGQAMLAGLPLLRFTTESRLEEICAALQAMGCGVYSPHRFTIEEGGGNTLPPSQLAFKRQADPKGLLNPGKMLTWHEPGWTYERMFDHGGRAAAPE